MKRSRSLLTLALLMMTEPAYASTLPRVDFHKGETMVAVGLPDLSLDYALTDHLSLGATWVSMGLPAYGFGAIRGTYRIGRVPWGGEYGLTAAVGLESNYPATPTTPLSYQSWGQIALDASLPLTRRFTIRATVGPILWGSYTLYWYAVPNLELAYELNSRNELTLGGNSLIGWRGIF